VSDAPRRILVRVPNWVGDVVMGTVAYRALRRAFPGARVTLLTKRTGALLLAGAPWFDESIVLPRDRGPLAFLRARKEIASRGFDLAVVFPNSFSSAWLAAAARVPRRLGYAQNGRRFLLTERLTPEREGRRRRPKYMGDYYLDLLLRIGVAGDGLGPELFVTAGEERAWSERREKLGLAEREPFVAVNPGASFGPSKLWDPASFARAAGEVARRHGARVLVLCAPGEESIARSVEDAVPGKPIRTSHDPVPLDVLKPCLRDAAILLTTDTGPRHVAVAFRRPVVTVMGPTDPRYTAAFLDRTRVLRVDVDCGPCHLKVCPLDHRCMTRIPPERMIAAAEDLLAPGSVPAS